MTDVIKESIDISLFSSPFSSPCSIVWQALGCTVRDVGRMCGHGTKLWCVNNKTKQLSQIHCRLQHHTALGLSLSISVCVTVFLSLSLSLFLQPSFSLLQTHTHKQMQAIRLCSQITHEHYWLWVCEEPVGGRRDATTWRQCGPCLVKELGL